MKVGILTMFNGLTSTYSLVNVVADHIKMMLNAGVEVKLLVCEDCNMDERFGVFLDERIEWVKICNRLNGKQIKWYDYSGADMPLHKTFYEEVEVISKDLVQSLADVDVCMMHDILYQGWHFVHNLSVRQAQKSLPDVKFISFTHSLPVEPPKKMVYPFSMRFSGMDNTIFAYPTLSGLGALAKQYSVPLGKCAAIYNSVPLIENLHESVQALHSTSDLYKPDYLIVYPGRLTTGKRFEKVAAFAGSLQTVTNKNVKVIFCDFPSADINSNTYKAIIKNTGKDFGINEEDILFTSDISGYEMGFPRAGVLDLFTLSNLYICPSFSESFGLTVLEAGGRGNFLVLNAKVPALKELGSSLDAYFLNWDAKNFGFDTHETYNPSEQEYYKEHASIIDKIISGEKALETKRRIRKLYNIDWIWYNQLLPLLEK